MTLISIGSIDPLKEIKVIIIDYDHLESSATDTPHRTCQEIGNQKLHKALTEHRAITQEMTSNNRTSLATFIDWLYVTMHLGSVL